MNSLPVRTASTSIIGLIVLGVLLFLPAWTLAYWQAWVFIIVFTISTQAIGVYLALKDPALLQRRMNAGPSAEQRTGQKIFMLFTAFSSIALFVFCALDHRFGWSPVPASVSILGDALVALGLFITLLVMRENSYGGSTVQTFEGQHVISTGPYGLIRHPMYAGSLIMIIGVPLALGSLWGLVIIVLMLPALIWRILDEEKLLSHDLLGYTAYEQQVRYRLLPYVW